MDKMTIYNRLPIWGQNLACYYEGSRIKQTRYSKNFWRFLSEYENRARWSYEQICDFRDARLRQMIHHCYDTVPYYRKLFNDGGINPKSIKTLEDLKVLPILTKDIVNANPDSFLSTAIPNKAMVTAHTSGTTGSGFVFKTTPEAISEQWAVWWRYRKALGLRYGTLCGQFGGRSIVPISQLGPPFYRWNRPNNILYLSTYHMSERNLLDYVYALQNNKISWIHGYPSSISLLAEYLLRHEIQLNIKYVTIGAENLLDSQKEKIYKAFGVYPYQHYGLSEAVANFSENQKHEMRVDEDFAAVEFVPKENTGSHEVIGSCLTNYAMPFLRYRTNDLANFISTTTGRMVISLDGRIEDYIVLSNGVKVGRLDHIFKDLMNIREAQIVQKNVNYIQVNIVKNSRYSTVDERQMLSEFKQRLPEIRIDINYLNEIPRTGNGKIRFVISEIKD